MMMQVVLVAHSMGGLTALQLMESFSSKIGLTIFVSAVLTASETPVFFNPTLSDLVNSVRLRCVFGFRSTAIP